MRKIYKNINIALIFILIGVFLCSDALYSCPVSRYALRVPVGDYERIEKSLNPIIRKISADRIEFFGENRGNLTVVQEARYKDEKGVMHECFAKWAERENMEKRIITPQARILRFLNNRNMQGIPRVLDFVETEDGRKIILFEKFPEGKTLDKKIGVLSEKRAVDIMLKVTRIVKFLLDHDVYHWDINPSNIWVTDQGEVILFDFDFAFMEEDEFIDRGLYAGGTKDYMSQRRVRRAWIGPSRRNILFSHADEIFSLGASLNKLLSKINKNRISPDLQSLINKALAEDGAGEYGTIDEFLGDLEKAATSMAAGNGPIEMIVDATRHASSNI